MRASCSGFRIVRMSADYSSWENGPALPETDETILFEAASVPYKDSFLVVGGNTDGEGYSDKIYEFDAARREFVMRQESLALARAHHVAVAVTDREFAC